MRVTLSGFLRYYFLSMPWQKNRIFCVFSENLHLQLAPSLDMDREALKLGFFTSLGCWLISEKDQRSRGLHKVEKTDFFCSWVNFLIKLLKLSKKNNTFFLDRIKEIWFIEKLRFNNRNSFYETDFHFRALKKSVVFFWHDFTAK